MKRTVLFCGVILTATLIGACIQVAGEDVTITATSVHESFGPDGLLKAVEPLARQNPADLSANINICVCTSSAIKQIGFLPQAGQLNQAPKRLTVEISDDGNTWKDVTAVEYDCNAPSENWRGHSLSNGVSTKNVRIKILSNCGDPAFLTLRGVRFKK